jgi:hypothetical protein
MKKLDTLLNGGWYPLAGAVFLCYNNEEIGYTVETEYILLLYRSQFRYNYEEIRYTVETLIPQRTERISHGVTTMKKSDTLLKRERVSEIVGRCFHPVLTMKRLDTILKGEESRARVIRPASPLHL